MNREFKSIAHIRAVPGLGEDVHEFVISTDSVDRHGTVVEPAGCDYSAYMKNPVVLANHKSFEFPVGKCLEIRVEPTQVFARVQLHRLTPEAAQVADLVANGYMNGASVGFIPVEWVEKKLDGGSVMAFTKWELYEFSIVTIPSNRDALKRNAGNSVRLLLEQLIRKRMLSPEQINLIQAQLLPALNDAIKSYIVDSLAIPAEMVKEIPLEVSQITVDALIARLDGKSVSLEIETEAPAETPAETPAPAPAETEQKAIRAGKKISMTNIQRITEGLNMINEGQAIIKAVADEANRSVVIKPAALAQNVNELLSII